MAFLDQNGQMGTLGKIGLMLQSFADPSVIPAHLEQQQKRQEFQLKLDALARERQQEELQQKAISSAMPLFQSGDIQGGYAALASVPAFADNAMNYFAQQADPARALELQIKRAQLANLGRPNYETIKTPEGDVMRYDPYAENPTTQMIYDAPAVPKVPDTTGLPEGQMWAPDALGNMTAVSIPGAKPKTTDLKEFQVKPAGFAARMDNAEALMMQATTKDKKAPYAKTGPAGFTESALSAIPSFGFTDKVGAAIVKGSSSPEEQQYLNAAQEWIRAKLRKESGAAISPQEMIDEYATYFPVPGDKEDVIAQKEKLRKFATDAMKKESAGGYESLFGEGQSVKFLGFE